jgi:hypothetical protein
VSEALVMSGCNSVQFNHLIGINEPRRLQPWQASLDPGLRWGCSFQHQQGGK